ncbi:cellulase (glycosyl hydrolase family 5) domain-containing protein [Ditylenchus destructor]|nr:cellulase (glycosyl hydrolase family 5) domain-containing protein [Ditylenchus destructor]
MAQIKAKSLAYRLTTPNKENWFYLVDEEVRPNLEVRDEAEGNDDVMPNQLNEIIRLARHSCQHLRLFRCRSTLRPTLGLRQIPEERQVQQKVQQNVQLRGMSLFWSQWMDKYYNAGTVQALKCSWNTNVVRAAMAVDQGGYLTNASAQLSNVNAVVQAAINQGIYVIIDWHAHDNYQSQAVQFFGQMAQKYAGVPNVLYETFNEPLQVSWTGNLVPYHTAVIKAIRQYDKKNIIIVGTPTWSQDVDVASQNPITGQTNIMYTLHYYAGTHKQDLRNKAQTAINNGLPIFVTEYGTVNADGNGGVDSASTQAWWDFLDQNMISYANWAVEDKSEGAAAFIPGTPATVAGVSSDSNLTPSGKMVKAKYKSQSNGVSC